MKYQLILPMSLAVAFGMQCSVPEYRDDDFSQATESGVPVMAVSTEVHFSSVYQAKNQKGDKFLASLRSLLLSCPDKSKIVYTREDLNNLGSTIFPVEDLYDDGQLESIEFSGSEVVFRYETGKKGIISAVPDSYNSLRALISKRAAFEKIPETNGSAHIKRKSGKFLIRPRKGLSDAEIKAVVKTFTGKDIEPRLDIIDIYLFPKETVVLDANGKYAVIGPDGFTDQLPNGFKQPQK